MLSGKSPFEGSSSFEILTRICTHRQRPLREVDPGIPAPLSAFVDRLLEKEPILRPHSAQEVVTALENVRIASRDETEIGVETQREPRAVMASPPPVNLTSSRGYNAGRPGLRWAIVAALLVVLAAALLWQRERPAPETIRKPATPAQIRVALRQPETAAGAGEDSHLLASSLRIAVLRSLLGFEGISPIPVDSADEAAGSPVQLARALAVQEVVTSRLDCRQETCQISLQRIQGSDGRALWSRTFSAVTDRPYLLEEAVRGYLGEAYTGYPQRDAIGLEVRPEDYAQYLRLRRTFEAKREGQTLSPETLIQGLESLRATSPRFLDAYVFEAEVRQQRYKSSQDPQDLDRADQLLSAARQLAPTDPRPLTGQFGVAMLRGQWDQAEAALGELERLQPGDPALLVQRARLLEKRGESKKALALMREGVSRYPSWRNLFRAAEMEFSLGHFDAARRDAEQLLANYPESYAGLAKLAEIEFLHGDLRHAVTLFSRLVERYPRPVEISNLGTALMYQGSYGEAEASFREVLALEPRNALTLLNLADAVSLAGRAAEAAPIYRQVELMRMGSGERTLIGSPPSGVTVIAN